MDPNEIDGLKLLLDEETTGESKDFQENASSGAAVRRHFRVNAEKCLAKVKVVIKGHEYEVLNLSLAGVGIRVKNSDEFPYRNILLPLTVMVGKKTFQVQGRVIHVSSHDSGDFICGMDFCDTSDEAAKAIGKLLAKSRGK